MSLARIAPSEAYRITLKELEWMADALERNEWLRTGFVVAKIHNANFKEAISPFDVGPYARAKSKNDLTRNFAQFAEVMKEMGAKVEFIPEEDIPEWVKSAE